MACRGVLFSLTAGDVERLLGAVGSDREVLMILREFESLWDEEHLQELDKAWDAIHRCLSDGTLRRQSTEMPLGACILGGNQLYHGKDYICSHADRGLTRRIADALKAWDQARFRERYYWLEGKGYEGPLDENDFEYTWDYFAMVKTFYEKAAGENRSVLFFVDQ